ncbi:MAG: transposase [Aeromonas sp.]
MTPKNNKRKKIKKEMTYYEENIMPLLNTNVERQLQFLMQKGILKSFKTCPCCGLFEKLVRYKRNKDGFAWRCMTASCFNYKKYSSIRRNSFLSDLTITMKQFILVLWKWSRDATQTDIITELSISRETINKILTKLRCNIRRFFDANPIRLGGPGIICQIDESLFRHKPKYHVGRYPSNEKWVFGIADTSYTPAKVFLQLVPNRQADTLLPIISQVCRDGTIIVSDQWRAYFNIADLGFEHSTVNHSYNFVDPASLRHTQNIESYWNKAKFRAKKMMGISGDSISEYLIEWMFKECYVCADFEKILEIIKLYS